MGFLEELLGGLVDLVLDVTLGHKKTRWIGFWILTLLCLALCGLFAWIGYVHFLSKDWLLVALFAVLILGMGVLWAVFAGSFFKNKAEK